MPTTPTPILGIPGPALADGPADIEAALLPLRNWLDTYLSASVASIPVGVQLPYSGLVLPDPVGPVEFKWCDGDLIDRTTYDVYFAIVQHAYNNGVDPGSNKFRLPDKRGRGSVGPDAFPAPSTRGAAGVLPSLAAGARVLGQRWGVDAVALTLAGHNAPHSHVPSFALFHGQPGSGNDGLPDVAPYVSAANGFSGVGTANPPYGGSNSSSGGGTAHNNLPPSEVDTWIVRVK